MLSREAGRKRDGKSPGGHLAERLTGFAVLTPSDPNYEPVHGGSAGTCGAYHKEQWWPWLLGPFLTAYVRVNGGSDLARRKQPSGLRP